MLQLHTESYHVQQAAANFARHGTPCYNRGSMPDIPQFYLGDIVRLRKPHACGGTDWEVVRLGADIGVTCRTCGHRVLIPRPKFEKSVKTVLQRGPAAPSAE